MGLESGSRRTSWLRFLGFDLWREFDLPPRLAGTRLFVNQRFHLRPLTALADVLPRVCIALVDRSRARIFELWMDEIAEKEKFTSEEIGRDRRGRRERTTRSFRAGVTIRN